MPDAAVTLGLLTIGVGFSVAVGILLGNRVRSRSWAIALGAGALVFLLLDLFKETASLGQGILDRGLQIALVLAFALGVILLAAFGKPGNATRLAWAWAIGIAAHGAGEAWLVGSEALTADITAPTQAASFVLHKIIEGATIPLVAGISLRRAEGAAITGVLAALALAFGWLGWVMGPGNEASLFFAAGAGATVFAIIVLAKRIPLDAKHAAAVAAGAIVVYLAGLLHEI